MMSKLAVLRSRALRAWWIAAALCLAACGGDDDDGSGKSSLGACGQLAGCGGELAGTWTIESACTDNLVQLMGVAVNEPACNGLVADTRTEATGTFTFTETTISSSATLSVDVTARYTQDCVMAIVDGAAVDLPAVCANLTDQYASMPSVSGASCGVVGEACDCILSFTQPISTSGSYTASGSTISYPNDPDPLTFCVEGDTLKLGGTMSNASILLTLRRS